MTITHSPHIVGDMADNGDKFVVICTLVRTGHNTPLSAIPVLYQGLIPARTSVSVIAHSPNVVRGDC